MRLKKIDKIESTHYLLAPPASGDTIVQFRQSEIFSLIHLSTAGSAYKLSTGISKKPYANKYNYERLLSVIIIYIIFKYTETP